MLKISMKTMETLYCCKIWFDANVFVFQTIWNAITQRTFILSLKLFTLGWSASMDIFCRAFHFLSHIKESMSHCNWDHVKFEFSRQNYFLGIPNLWEAYRKLLLQQTNVERLKRKKAKKNILVWVEDRTRNLLNMSKRWNHWATTSRLIIRLTKMSLLSCLTGWRWTSDKQFVYPSVQMLSKVFWLKVSLHQS